MASDPVLVSPLVGPVETLLLVTIADRTLGLPVQHIDGLFRMAAFTPLPEGALGVVGMLNLHGALLPVVDLRPRLELPTAAPDPDQILVLLSARNRFFLWVDSARSIADIPSGRFEPVSGDTSLVMGVANVVEEIVPVLRIEALDPGQLPDTDGAVA